jgi:hypothetical protein
VGINFPSPPFITWQKPDLNRPFSFHSFRWWVLIPILILILFGIVLRVAIGVSDELWLDELHTAWTTDGKWNQIAPRAKSGNQTPVYFWLVWLLRHGLEPYVGNQSLLLLRTVSIFFGSGLIALTAWLLWSWTGSKLATLCATWLVATEPTLIFYASEARPYAGIQFFGLLQVILFWKWLNRFKEPGRSHLEKGTTGRDFSRGKGLSISEAGLGICTAVMILMHPTSLWLPVAEITFVFFVWLYQAFTLRTIPMVADFSWLLRSGFRIGLICGLFILPSIGLYQGLVQRRDQWKLVSNATDLLVEIQLSLRWWMLMPLIFAVVIKAFDGPQFRNLCCETAGESQKDNFHGDLPLKMAFVACWALIPLAGSLVVDHFGIAPAANRRYIQVGAIAIPIFGALYVAGFSQNWQRMFLSVGLLISSLVLSPWLVPMATTATLPRFRYEDWQSPVHEINRHPQRRSAPVFLFANLLEDRFALANPDEGFQEYLRFPLTTFSSLDLNHRQLLSYPTLERVAIRGADLNVVERNQGAWLIIRGQGELTREILEDFCDQLEQFSQSRDTAQPWSTHWAEFELSRWSAVRLFWIEPQVFNGDAEQN